MVALPSTQCNKNGSPLRPFFSVIVAATLLLVQALCAAAQHASPSSSGPSEKEKARMQEKRAFEKDVDEAYKSTLGRMPDAKEQKVDPWGSMRTAPQK